MMSSIDITDINFGFKSTTKFGINIKEKPLWDKFFKQNFYLFNESYKIVKQNVLQGWLRIRICAEIVPVLKPSSSDRDREIHAQEDITENSNSSKTSKSNKNEFVGHKLLLKIDLCYARDKSLKTFSVKFNKLRLQYKNQDAKEVLSSQILEENSRQTTSDIIIKKIYSIETAVMSEIPDTVETYVEFLCVSSELINIGNANFFESASYCLGLLSI